MGCALMTYCQICIVENEGGDHIEEVYRKYLSSPRTRRMRECNRRGKMLHRRIVPEVSLRTYYRLREETVQTKWIRDISSDLMRSIRGFNGQEPYLELLIQISHSVQNRCHRDCADNLGIVNNVITVDPRSAAMDLEEELKVCLFSILTLDSLLHFHPYYLDLSYIRRILADISRQKVRCHSEMPISGFKRTYRN